MQINLLKADTFISKSWGGGVTTELFCYPPNAVYAERNFDFRLSTATVEVEVSKFTPLKGVSRTLMILDGEMTLAHENHHTKTLKKFDFDCFDGGWKTKSEGTCVDFNLMTRGRISGKLEAHIVTEKRKKDFIITPKTLFTFLYLAKGEINVNATTEACVLYEGDLLLIEESGGNGLKIESNQHSELIVVTINK